MANRRKRKQFVIGSTIQPVDTSVNTRDYTHVGETGYDQNAVIGASPTRTSTPAGGAPIVTPSTGTAPQIPGQLNPEDFPTVVRPDVPSVTDQAPPGTEDTIIGRFASFMDNIVPDDMGGLARGENDQGQPVGWAGYIPGYRQTLGKVAGTGLDVLGGGMDALMWVTDQVNHLGAALISVAPGGIQTLDWEQSHQVSAGQAFVTSVGIESKRIREGKGRPSDLLLANAITAPFIAAGMLAKDSPVQADNFDILNPAMKEAAFSQGWERFFSGTFDAGWSFVDPTIIGGKASAVLRTGMKAGEFAGLSNRAVRTAGQVARTSSEIDKNILYVTSRGAEGEWTALGEHISYLISNSPDKLKNSIFVKNSTNEKLLTELASQIHPDDFQAGAALIKASIGDVNGWVELSHLSPNVYLQLAGHYGLNPLKHAAGSVELSDEVVKLGNAVRDETKALVKSMSELEKADVLRGMSDAERLAASREAAAGAGQIISRVGNKPSAKMAHWANVYRQQAARSDFAKGIRSPKGLDPNKQFGVGWTGPIVDDQIHVFPDQDFISTVVRYSANSIPIRTLRYVGRGTPNGIVHLKGGDGNASLNEVRAFLQKSTFDRETRISWYNRFASASDPTTRLNIIKAMEEAEVSGIGAKHGIDADTARQIYDSYNKTRNGFLNSFKKSQEGEKPGFAIDPDTNEMVESPFLYTELEESVPLLDQTEMNRIITANKNTLLNMANRGMQHGVDVMDTLNTFWKLSVLMRFGYTQRNITEGALRSLATVGFLAMHPSAIARTPANAYYYMKARGIQRTARMDQFNLQKAADNVKSIHNMILDERKAARYAEHDVLVAKANAIKNDMISLADAIKASGKNPTKTQIKKLNAMKKKMDANNAEAQRIRDNIKAKGYDEKIAQLWEQSDKSLEELSAIRDRLIKMYETSRKLSAKRKRIGYGGNVMSGGERYAAAFDGAEGDIARALSSVDDTVNATFTAHYSRRIAELDSYSEWAKLDPAKIDPKDVGAIDNYYQNLADRLNRVWRNDALFKRWAKMEGASDQEILMDSRNWLMSDAGAGYRKTISKAGHNLEVNGVPDSKAVNDYLTEVWKFYDNEIPRGTGLRETLLNDIVSADELRTRFAGYTLPAIPGKPTKAPIPETFSAAARQKVDKVTGFVMKWLGSQPENTLLRHPYYSALYDKRQREMYNLFKSQGLDMSSDAVIHGINRSARDFALKETRRTMYTIERQSNLSTWLRWVSPFFPAFENSLRTWGRIVYENPAVLGVGDKLWNIPNELGWVIDSQTGERKDHSSFLRDENSLIVFPEPVARAFAATPFKGLLGGYFLEDGETLVAAQQGFNVVFQGSVFYDPSLGPAISMPASAILRNKPEVSEVLRASIGEKAYRNLVPYSSAGGNWYEPLLSTSEKRIYNAISGPDGDGAYKATLDALVEDAYITAQLEGRAFTADDMTAAERKASEFTKWQIWNAFTAFTPTKFQSKYAPQRYAWRQLLDDQSLTYEEKTKKFLEKFPVNGDAFLAVTRSRTESEFGLSPNIKTWQKISGQPGLVDKLYAIDKEAVAMFANMGSYDDPFSPAVYAAYKGLQIGEGEKAVMASSMREPQDIVANNQIADGWIEYRKAQAYVEEKLKADGVVNIPNSQVYQDAMKAASAEIGTRYPAWLDRKEQYVNKLPQFIKAARIIVDNKNLVGEDSTVAALAEYLQTRDQIAEAKAKTNSSDAKKQLNQVAYAVAADLRNKDIGFADLYDTYFANDDFRVVR